MVLSGLQQACASPYLWPWQLQHIGLFSWAGSTWCLLISSADSPRSLCLQHPRRLKLRFDPNSYTLWLPRASLQGILPYYTLPGHIDFSLEPWCKLCFLVALPFFIWGEMVPCEWYQVLLPPWEADGSLGPGCMILCAAAGVWGLCLFASQQENPIKKWPLQWMDQWQIVRALTQRESRHLVHPWI